MSTLICYQLQILRRCLHLTSLKVGFIAWVDVREVVDALQPAENIVDLELNWLDDDLPAPDLLPVLKEWSHLRRLTLLGDPESFDMPRIDLLCNFIRQMDHLTYLSIANMNVFQNLEYLVSTYGHFVGFW